MTTHYMDEAEVCDRVAIIDRGRIIACDTPSALKSSLKGDTIHLKTEDDDAAMLEINDRFGLKAVMTEAGLFIIVDNGERFIPRLFEQLKTGILSISLKRPSLEDVFLNLTGKEIREGNGHGKGTVVRHGG
jgi:ABC-2 type transport system ATP-binding protein